MFEKLRKSKLMFWSLELLIISAFVFVLTKINFLFAPVGTFFSTLFAPVLIAGFLYYLLNPMVNLLMKLKLKRIYSILIVFILLILAIVWLSLSFIPSLVNQISALATNMPTLVKNTQAWLTDISNLPMFKDLDITKYIEQLNLSYGDIIQQFLSGLSSGLGSVVGTIASTTMTIFTVPFILFYMLKDSDKLVPNIKRFFPEGRRAQIVELLGQMNQTLANYISGQAIECVFVGTFTFLGYLIIGVDYAFLFGVIAGLTNLIPYLGPYLGLAPAFLVTVFDSPFQALLCGVVVLVVQQLDGNIIYPNVIGKSLQIHPLTIILVLLVAGNISGLLGIFLGIPLYAVCKTIVAFVVKVVREDYAHQNDQNDQDDKFKVTFDEQSENHLKND
ncbi:AI-2E family transporter [Candidatus Enterococcus huntleyi]|uniref:AI-2E family transporter n=1 Tax=Candidatus Enterococcus huntleyi TaxID=1857217 RepID=UPI00137A0B6D|nr:AI-2E family transporter [Enterococcus sp. JM4C]